MSSSPAVILVHYHAAGWLARAVAALRRDDPDAELIVVDNGSTPAEAAAIAALGVRLLPAGGNRGYAGGVNLGVAATRAARLVLMNPDVEVAPGCVRALVAELDAGAAAAGPRFFWDAGRELILPPTERREPAEHALRRLAPRGEPWRGLALRRWRRHARRHWLATRPLPSYALSGALLAVRRDAWDAIGPFDDGYQLYFEETDWLLRLARRRLRAVCVPAAVAVHHFNQSAAREPAAAGWYAASEARFERRYAWWLRAALARCAPVSPVAAPPAPAGPVELAVAGARWVEVSPSPLGFPAAAAQPAPGTRAWRLPDTVWAHLGPGTYHLCALDGADRVLARRAFTKGSP